MNGAIVRDCHASSGRYTTTELTAMHLSAHSACSLERMKFIGGTSMIAASA
ncbi:hypothetical protein [Bifidobacterium sp.]|uniref:hypothetical protein n=1 Tax=Bifidobacterium sp. TaxID=41200 RepID=UPI0039EB8467